MGQNKFLAVLEAVGKGIAYPFVHTAQFVVLIKDVLEDAPQVKSDLTTMVEMAEKVIADVGGDVASKGLNFAQDEQTLADVQAFFAFFESEFLPTVEKAYTALKSDTSPVSSDPAPSA